MQEELKQTHRKGGREEGTKEEGIPERAAEKILEVSSIDQRALAS